MEYYLIGSEDSSELYHHGILGQKWGIRRYQSYDTVPRGSGKTGKEIGAAKKQSRIEKKDIRWAKRNQDRILKKGYRVTKKDMNQYVKKELNKQYKAELKSGKPSRNYQNAYNQKLAQLMNEKVSDITAPSGRAVRFVAKRGELGVYVALTGSDYDMGKLKRGVYSSGRVAYKKDSLNVAHSELYHHGILGQKMG